jgi:hypothetical protein
MEDQITLEEIVVLARQLPLEDKVRLVEIITPAIEREARTDLSAAWAARKDGPRAPANDGYIASSYDPVEAWRTFTYNEVN